MKNIKYLLFAVLTFFATTLLVNASEITKVTYDGTFKIEGTGSGQIQVALFDLDGNPLYLTTVLATNNSFSIELPKIDGIKNGNYKVKVANYDGTGVDSESVTVTNSTTVKETNPQTVDKLLIYITIGAISLIGLFVSGFYLSKKKVRL